MKKKWETNRGIGNSYGYNRMENEEDYLDSEKIIRMFVDIVSKNGNLLLNVGPMADGTIPEHQRKVLLNLGEWLEINGEAIYDTHPWVKAEGVTIDGIEVRYTITQESLFVTLLEEPEEKELEIKSLVINEKSTVRLLGNDNEIEWSQMEENLKLKIPDDLFNSPAYSFKITPTPDEGIN